MVGHDSQDLRIRRRGRPESRRRPRPWLAVLAVAAALFLVSIGLTIVFGLMLEARIDAIEAVVGIAAE